MQVESSSASLPGPPDAPHCAPGGGAKRQRTASTAAAEASSKKLARPSEEFRLTFTNPQAFKQMVEIISNILSECHFQIYTKKSPGEFEGIVVESIDSKMVCMITARLECQAEGRDGVFCVKMSTLNTLLKSVQPHCCLDIFRSTGSPDVEIHAYERSSTACRSRFSLRTLAKDIHNVKLDDIDYEYTVEMDMVSLRQIVKMARDLKATVLRFTVEEPREQGGSRHTFLKVAADGDDADIVHCFHSITEWETESDGQGNVVIRTADESEEAAESMDLVSKYSERFSTEYLSYFLKSMERHPLTMRLSSEKPLILQYSLGSEDSSVCFVLAPKID